MAGLVAVGTTLLNSALRCSLLAYSPQWWVATACVTSSISQGNFGAWMAGAMFRVSDEGERSVEGDRERWGRLRLWGGIGYVRTPPADPLDRLAAACSLTVLQLHTAINSPSKHRRLNLLRRSEPRESLSV